MPDYRTARRGITYSEALAAAYASAPEAEVILDTLEFRHPLFLEGGSPFGIRVVNDHSNLTATLEADAPLNPGAAVLFYAVYFQFVRPSESESGSVPEVEITVDNVARHLMQYLDAAKGSRSPISVTWRPYLASDLTAPHMNPPLTLTLRNVQCNMTTVTARAGYGDLTNRRFPAIEYTSKKFPQLTAR
jgi:hypothetical protein